MITLTGLLFVSFLQHCTVKIVFKDYSKVELATTVPSPINLLMCFASLIDNWCGSLAFHRRRVGLGGH